MLITLKVLVGIAIAILVIGLIVGLIKPKWVLFWMDNPTRFGVVAIVTAFAILVFMIAWTTYAVMYLKPKEKGVTQNRQAEEQQEIRLDR